MFRPVALVGVALVLGIAVPVAAQEKPGRGLVAPSAAVAEAWAQEAKERELLNAQSKAGGVGRPLMAPSAAVAAAWAKEVEHRQTLYPTTSKSMKALYASYGVMQGLDMYSTIAARRNGAREVNPIMDTGYAQASLVKGLMAAGTFAAVKKIEKKNKKAAVITMVAMNVATAAVVANNFRNARRLR